MELTADTEQSAPDLWLPQARQALLGDTRHWPHPRETPAELTSFVRAFGRLRTRIGRQVGGHAVPVQGPVEYDIANAALGGGHEWGEQPLDQEAERWGVLAQFDSDCDAKMAWGDEGTLYWLAPRTSQANVSTRPGSPCRGSRLPPPAPPAGRRNHFWRPDH